eukprot:7262440-Karenia_brevis.AAC.1
MKLTSALWGVSSTKFIPEQVGLLKQLGFVPRALANMPLLDVGRFIGPLCLLALQNGLNL